MDLLNGLLRHPLDPDYAVVAARGQPPTRGRWGLAAVALLVGLLFAVAAVQATRSAPSAESERLDLIRQIRQAETAQDQLRQRAAALSAEVDGLRTAALGDDRSGRRLNADLASVSPAVGSSPVHGPGLRIVVDDAPSDSGDSRDRILDLDLQALANGLWQAGADAVAVNGHRLSALSAIRNAGDAITVDYRSLTRPYVVEAIGDPQTLPARWVESSGGAWWNELEQNRRMRYEVSTVEDLTLQADPDLVVRYAKRGGS
jgi:uncharacterized protein YlxW (UPF0749 family)